MISHIKQRHYFYQNKAYQVVSNIIKCLVKMPKLYKIIFTLSSLEIFCTIKYCDVLNCQGRNNLLLLNICDLDIFKITLKTLKNIEIQFFKKIVIFCYSSIRTDKILWSSLLWKRILKYLPYFQMHKSIRCGDISQPLSFKPIMCTFYIFRMDKFYIVKITNAKWKQKVRRQWIFMNKHTDYD